MAVALAEMRLVVAVAVAAAVYAKEASVVASVVAAAVAGKAPVSAFVDEPVAAVAAFEKEAAAVSVAA